MCETRNFYLWLLQVVVLTIILFLLLWFLLPPRSPKYTIIDFYVPAFNEAMNTTTSPGQEILIHNTTIIFHLEIENPNEDYTITCDLTKVTLYYGNDSLGETTFQQIVSMDKGEIVENGMVNGDRHLLQKAVSGAVRNRTTTKTMNMELRMGLVNRIKYKMWFWKSKHHGVNMEGKVPVGKDGKISAKKKRLRLYRVKKKFKK
ncbi:uncharacterized protein LOC122091076 isoform X2 [Macadamia integrifolia]|nr:uncharacterized protein LOC122091076 isoform X2 [Macadamia integrifolia]XP_042516834.1 uncharacterized protein LOC122091076 isoform X2 [Macadamia integrifolia]XP_042516835.1 uncharacterized protein LOC122091076 isoform X2 [Macadamia integrifolia]XP_042516836.1 uncharacterized protein LOC122091076 isoform X2 [Macadamia integrifolia]XP_042516837.1 uncharacterized protein LOC122091076 isoform X2 [Macadamia integrifolia]